MEDGTKIEIKPVRKKNINALISLEKEFDGYLSRLSRSPRKPFSIRRQIKKTLKDGFGKDKAFQGFIARKGKVAVGYILYHIGYDPDEMKGRVIYVIDLFVSEKARGLGVGSSLMKAVATECKKIGGLDVYFGVWLRNKSAIKFYKKLGADWVKEVPFMRWDKKHWKV
jgi:ribosomal protein S18 acetylase RimI-like enzyme